MFKLILLVSFIYCLSIMVFGQNQQTGAGIAFPEEPVHLELDEKRKNADNRIPIFHPTQCKDNELFYPGDQKDDWICDCVPGHIFYPPEDKCFPVYQQGPCQDGQYLILPPRKNIPECTINPCRLPKMVLFQNQCYELLKAGPCPSPELSNVVGVNITTLNIECIKQSPTLLTIVINRFSEEPLPSPLPLPKPIGVCAKGTKRALNGTCVPTTETYDLPDQSF